MGYLNANKVLENHLENSLLNKAASGKIVSKDLHRVYRDLINNEETTYKSLSLIHSKWLIETLSIFTQKMGKIPSVRVVDNNPLTGEKIFSIKP